VGTQFEPNPDYASTIEAWDGVGLRIERPDEIAAVLEAGLDALDSGQQVLIDAHIDDAIPEIEPPE
jgi:thiamine pyrophosphate-dependent acetolactate synthase large subunit-like protein